MSDNKETSKAKSEQDDKAGTEEESVNEGASGGSSSGSRRSSQTEKIQNYVSGLLSKLSLGSGSKPKILEEPTIDGVVKYIKSDKCKNIVIMAGAGISTAAGIPDFRSPGSGLYESIQKKYKLSDPQIMFEIGFFRANPEPFFSLAKQLFPSEFNPTLSHHFVRLLHNKGYLLRHYTQNIDGLERNAGIPGGKIVEAHGSFHTSHCLKSSCHKEYSFDWMKEKIMSGTVPKCTECDSTVKPDVVFFGEALPPRFFSCATNDFPKCDLLIILGTSLVVQPFAYLVNQVSADTPRVLINREIVGVGSFFSKGLDFKSERNRDVAILGECDDGIMRLADALFWKDDLLKLQEEAKLPKAATTNQSSSQ